jgi:DNA polymerase epsilon subunit 3
MSTAAAEPPVAAGAAASSGGASGQKRARKDIEEVPTAPVPDVLALPLAPIMRIIRSKLPDGVMVGTETKKAFGKACSLFILYLTTIASDIAKENSRSTVTGADVLAALRDLEFDDLIPSVESSIAAFREGEKARSIEQAAKKAVKGPHQAAEDAAKDDAHMKEDDEEAELAADEDDEEQQEEDEDEKE